LILNNPQSRPPARIERWNLHVQDYDFNVRYTKGLDNPSDFLSRHLPVNNTTDDRQFQTMADNYVCFLTQHAVPRAITLPEIQQATVADSPLCRYQRLSRGVDPRATQGICQNSLDKRTLMPVGLSKTLSQIPLPPRRNLQNNNFKYNKWLLIYKEICSKLMPLIYLSTYFWASRSINNEA
jgi:hypothetical protein